MSLKGKRDSSLAYPRFQVPRQIMETHVTQL